MISSFLFPQKGCPTLLLDIQGKNFYSGTTGTDPALNDPNLPSQLQGQHSISTDSWRRLYASKTAHYFQPKIGVYKEPLGGEKCYLRD